MRPLSGVCARARGERLTTVPFADSSGMLGDADRPPSRAGPLPSSAAAAADVLKDAEKFAQPAPAAPAAARCRPGDDGCRILPNLTNPFSRLFAYQKITIFEYAFGCIPNIII